MYTVMTKKGLITDVQNLKQAEPGEHDSNCPVITHSKVRRG